MPRHPVLHTMTLLARFAPKPRRARGMHLSRPAPLGQTPSVVGDCVMERGRGEGCVAGERQNTHYLHSLRMWIFWGKNYVPLKHLPWRKCPYVVVLHARRAHGTVDFVPDLCGRRGLDPGAKAAAADVGGVGA
jgi:hypothetical protein